MPSRYLTSSSGSAILSASIFACSCSIFRPPMMGNTYGNSIGRMRLRAFCADLLHHLESLENFLLAFHSPPLKIVHHENCCQHSARGYASGSASLCTMLTVIASLPTPFFFPVGTSLTRSQETAGRQGRPCHGAHERNAFAFEDVTTALTDTNGGLPIRRAYRLASAFDTIQTGLSRDSYNGGPPTNSRS
ncbi:hypothetical protein BC628DRAFT_181518 [Trametes gibbosa]|nr:hypothetical protein BC628DRAFT_181518 [Trametes gibbosa]